MNVFRVSLIAAALIGLTACQSLSTSGTMASSPKEEQGSLQAPAEKLNNGQLFEVHKDGRIYVFYDFASYKEFSTLGHTPFVFTKIGAGPKGETLVYSLTSDDKEKKEGIASVELMEGRLAPAEDFYAEMKMDGRTYVFSRFEDMAPVRKLGEAPLRHAKIGYGSQGESVIFVLNEENKEIHPEALISRFDSLNK